MCHSWTTQSVWEGEKRRQRQRFKNVLECCDYSDILDLGGNKDHQRWSQCHHQLFLHGRSPIWMGCILQWQWREVSCKIFVKVCWRFSEVVQFDEFFFFKLFSFFYRALRTMIDLGRITEKCTDCPQIMPIAGDLTMNGHNRHIYRLGYKGAQSFGVKVSFS